MGRRGPPPTPTALRALQGERRPSILGHEPPGRIGRPEAPTHFDDDQRAAFDRLLELIPPAVATATDSLSVEGLADAWVRYRRSSAAALETGPVVAGAEAAIVASPAWRAARLDSALLLRWAGEFGLTPRARAELRFAGLAVAEDDGAAALLSG